CRANQASLDWFDMDELSGRSLEEVFTAEVFAALAPWLEAALAGKATNGEVTLTRANDGARRFQASYIPYCDNDSVRGCYLILSAQQGHDGLHLDDRDQNRLVYIQRLAMIGEMATTLAHDLNQPLSAINSY